MVFSPQPGEVLYGTIKSQTGSAIFVEVANVNIVVPAPSGLLKNCVFDGQKWCWRYQDPGASNNQNLFHELPFETGKQIKIKIDKNNIDRESRNFLVGHCAENGLGMIEWWKQN